MPTHPRPTSLTLSPLPPSLSSTSRLAFPLMQEAYKPANSAHRSLAREWLLWSREGGRRLTTSSYAARTPTRQQSSPSPPPPLAFPSVAQLLPYDVLVRIFEQSARAPRQQDWGGLLCGWQSNEDVCRLAMVCGSWRLPAEHVLYRSCSLLSAKDAASFIETTKRRTDLAAMVQFLVVGLSEEETWPSSDDEGVTGGMVTGRTQAETSALMVTALAACSRLRHFQIRPLHESAREGLLVALAETKLESLICSPRLRKPDVEWTGCLFRRADIVKLVLPTLRNFELDAWTNSTDPHDPDYVEEAPPSPSFPSSILSSSLVTLRLRSDISDDHLFALLSACGSTLEIADIYFERIVAPAPAAEALSHALGTLRELRWTTNPPIEGFAEVNLSPTPLFDRVLPRFQVLSSLSISATDVSPSILSLLPPCLVEVEVQAYTYRGPFKLSEEMIKTLANRKEKFTLKRFTVCDSEEVRSEDNVAAMTHSCAARGIAFSFIADEDREVDSV